MSEIDPVVRQARELSSGTLSYLCNDTRYSVIDQVRADFIDFCVECGERFETWQQAWKAYERAKNGQ